MDKTYLDGDVEQGGKLHHSTTVSSKDCGILMTEAQLQSELNKSRKNYKVVGSIPFDLFCHMQLEANVQGRELTGKDAKQFFKEHPYLKA